MDIIIVGCGKAGLLHKNAYVELIGQSIVKGKLFFIDRNQKPIWGNYNNASQLFNLNENIYRDIYELINNESVDIDNTIVDICLPVGTMLTTIKQFKECGFKKFICEKPLVFYREKVLCPKEVLAGLNIKTVENYLYSKPTICAKDFIEKYNLVSKYTLVANFSKNRKIDSSCYRGFSTKQSTLTVWEIEIPHLIYICKSLFGNMEEILFKRAYDMKIGDLILKNHGSGILICSSNNGNTYLLNSNLDDNKLNRNIKLIYSDNYILHIFYSPLDKEEHENKCGVVLTYNGNVVDKCTFQQDNNIYEMLKDYYQDFRYRKTDSFQKIQSMIEFSEFMEKLVEG